MSINLAKVKNFLTSKAISATAAASPAESEVGFRITYCEQTRQLKVRVIGARHLPTIFGNLRPQGYLVKVRVFPGKEKYETQCAKESWPNFNEEFTFDLQGNGNKIDEQFLGKFVTFTVYANLEVQNAHKKVQSKNSLKSYLFGSGEDEPKEKSRNRASMKNRRTVGAVTYNLDAKNFSQKLKGTSVATLDIWRTIQNISSGIQTEAKQQLEVTLSYSNSEDGNNDLFEMTLSRLRCSMQTMQDHEKLKGSLQIKMTAFEYNVLIAKWRSDRFDPTISMRIEPNTAVLRAFFRNYNLENVKMVIRLFSKNSLSKKVLLGTIEIDDKSDLWKQVVAAPSTHVTQIINFQ